MTDDSAEEYEREYSASRAEAGDLLRKLGDGVEGGGVRFGGEDDVTVAVPAWVDLEIEVETEEGERELEVELTWPFGGADERAETDEPETAETERTATDDPTAESTGREESDSAAEPSMPAGPAEEIAPLGTETDGTTPESGSRARFELFRDRADEWRWRLIHDNGNVIADSGEGYTRKESAKKGLRSVMSNAPGATIEERD